MGAVAKFPKTKNFYSTKLNFFVMAIFLSLTAMPPAREGRHLIPSCLISAAFAAHLPYVTQ
jgi:hypothetical protein